MNFYRYLDESDVHVIDCAGRVDLELGLARLKALAIELEARPARGARRRLLIDLRNTVWENEGVHRQLSLATRRDFGLNPQNAGLRVAILNHRWQGAIAENEHWFLDDVAALDWLKE